MPYIGRNHIAGDHTSNFKVLDDISSYTATFNGSLSTIVSTTDNTIRIPEHRFIQGQRVTYSNGGGGNIGGLTNGTAYFVTFDTANTFKLATSLANANNNTNINLSSVGTGSAHTLTAAFDGVNTTFKITHTGGSSADIVNSAQLQIAINNVIQKANLDSSYTEGFLVVDSRKIQFKTAPTSDDIFWGNIIANTIETFDISDLKIDQFTGDGVTTQFTLSRDVPNNQSVMVTLDGVVQHPSDKDTTRAYRILADTVIEFSSPPGLSIEIQVRHLGFSGASTGDVTGFYGRTGNVVLGASDHITTGDITPRNINASGIVTASSFVGNLTGNVSGNLTVGGVLTYEDVTNVDSIGIITARSDIHVGAGVSAVGVGTFGSLDIGGDIDVDGHTNLDNVSIAGVSTHSEGIHIPDNKRLDFGGTAGDGDFEIRHTSGNTFIENNTGAFFITQGTSASSNPLTIHGGSELQLKHYYSNGGALFALKSVRGYQTEIYYQGAKKIETTAKGILVGTGVTIETNGQATFTGIVTASTYYGDGSNLSNITSTTINNNADNRIITGSGTANTLNGESNVLIDSSGRLLIGTSTEGHPNANNITIAGSTNSGITFRSANDSFAAIYFSDATSGTAEYEGAIVYGHSDNTLRFGTNHDTWLEINSSGGVTPYQDITNDLGTSSKKWRNVYAQTLYGDGSNLTGITGTTINNNANNRIITGSGTANTLEGESSFTYDGNGMVDIEGTAAAGIQIKTPNNTDGGVYFRTGSSNPGAVTYQHSDNSMRYRVNSTEKLRIDSDGKLLLGNGSYNSNSNGFKMSIKESSNENAAIMFLDTDNMKGGICGIAKGNDQIITGTTNVDFVLGSLYADTHIIYGTPSNQAGAIGMTLKADTGHIVIEEGLGIGGVDPGGSTLSVNGSLNLSSGGNTSWQKVTLNGSNNTAGDALSINNWGDAEGDYWGLMVNQTMNQSGNYSKTNSGKRTSYITLDGRMGRVYLGGAGTGTNPTEHFYTNWDGTVYMNSGFGSVAPFYGVRAWVQGNSGTTNGSGGLSSMSRVSTGKYRLNFATTMPDDNYATGCLANNNYDDTSWHGNTETTSVDVHFYTGSSYVDPSEWSAWVIR